jgi:hypothetical protein
LTKVRRVIGRDRVEAVELEHVLTGSVRTIACDTVVFTGDWIPDHELARIGGLDLNPGSLGPAIDTMMRTSRPGVFAIGNLVHPVDTADVCSLDGRHVAPSVRDFLGGLRPKDEGVALEVEAPLQWVAPNVVRVGDGAPARRRLLLWSDEFRQIAKISAGQDGRNIGKITLPWPVAPGRVLRVPWSLVTSHDPHGGPITLSLT